MTEPIISETIQGAIIALIGVGLGLIVNLFIENRKTKIEHKKDVRQRLIGNRILPSEVMEFVKEQRSIRPFKRLERDYIRFKWLFSGKWKTSGWESFPTRLRTTSPDLSYANLSGIKLQRQNLNYVTFLHSDVNEADLRECNLEDVDFRYTKLKGTLLGGSSMARSYIAYTDLSEADIVEVSFRSAMLECVTLLGVVWYQIDYLSSNWYRLRKLILCEQMNKLYILRGTFLNSHILSNGLQYKCLGSVEIFVASLIYLRSSIPNSSFP